MEKKNILIIFLFLILIGINYLITYKWLDPDFGWHLKTGELILERGIPKTDWYSYTMTDLSWISHEWLTDVLIYKTHSSVGFLTLLLIFLTLTVSSFLIAIKTKKFSYFLIPIILGVFSTFGFLGVRPQILTIFFVAVLWRILNKFLENSSSRLIYPVRKDRDLHLITFSQNEEIYSNSAQAFQGAKLSNGVYFLPFLFIAWANLHGGFFVGLFILFLVLVLEILKKTTFLKKILTGRIFHGQNFREQPIKKIITLSAILILCFLATLINPYGLRIYEEIFRLMGNSFLSWHIVEWLPLFFVNSLPVFPILYLALFLGLLLPQYKKIEFNYLIFSLIFFIFSLLHVRHFFIFVILTIPIFAELLFHLKKAINPANFNILFGGVNKWLFIFIILGIITYGLYPYFVSAFKGDLATFYPQKAIPFLKTLPLSENLLNEYGWGGYLIWKLPERKLFIDGRMISWSVFGDYMKIMKAKENFQELLEKYNVKIALLEKDKKTKAEEKKELKPENKLSRFLKKQNWLLKFLGIEPQEKNLYSELIENGWRVVYEDESAVILRIQ